MTVTSTYSLASINQHVANTFTTDAQHSSDVLRLSDGGYVVAYNTEGVGEGFVLLDFYGPDGQHIIQRQAFVSLANTSARLTKA